MNVSPAVFGATMSIFVAFSAPLRAATISSPVSVDDETLGPFIVHDPGPPGDPLEPFIVDDPGPYGDPLGPFIVHDPGPFEPLGPAIVHDPGPFLGPGITSDLGLVELVAAESNVIDSSRPLVVSDFGSAPTPIPAALPLLVSGLGLMSFMGFFGRWRSSSPIAG